MLLAGGRLGAVRILAPATVARMASPSTSPDVRAVRGLGWDIDSSYSSNRGELFPIGSYRHTGLTGTPLWLDPAAERYGVFPANSVHPLGNGRGAAAPRKEPSDAAAAVLPH